MKDFLPIGKSAKFLGVSIDTIRRWDKLGKLHSVRPDGKNRFFPVEELQKIKAGKPLTVSEVAKEMGVSPSTVRRLEKKINFTPQRNESMSRIYTKGNLSELRRAIEPQEVHKKDLLPRFSLPQLNLASASSITIIMLILTTSLSSLYLRELFVRNQAQIVRSTAKVLGAKDEGGVVGFINGVSSYFINVNKKAIDQYKATFQVIQRTVVERTVVQKTTEVQKLIVDKEMIDNLNAEFVQGKRPGIEEGDLAFYSSNGEIDALKFSAANLSAGSISGGTGGLILDSSITSADLANDVVTGSKILNDTVKNEDIVGNAINSAKIEDNTVSTSDLSSSLAFANGDFIDLSQINHTSTSQQGLLLPNVSSASPTDPLTGEGYLAYDISGNQVLVFNGSSWQAVGSALTLYTGSSGSSTTSSASGMEFMNTTQLSLVRGCNDTQVLKWNNTAKTWGCADDSGAAGSGISTLKEGGINIITSATAMNFAAADFAVTNEGAGQGGVAIDYTSSKIVRSDQTQSITGAWTFSTAPVISSISNTGILTLPTSTDALVARSTSDTLTNKTISGASNTLSNIGNSSLSNSAITFAGNTGSGTVSLGGTLTVSGGGINNAAYLGGTITITGTEADTLATVTGRGATTSTDLTLGNVSLSSSKSLVIGSYASDPISPTDGTIWYNSTSGKYKIREGGTTKILCNATDLGCGAGGGGGVSTIKEGGINIVTSATALNYATNDFAVTDETGGQAGIAIDYTNSKITRSSDSSISFAGAITLNTTGNTNGVTINTATGSSGNSGGITIQTGGTATLGTSGSVAIDVGAGASANGTVSIGTTNASGLTIGRATVTTTVNGTLAAGGVSISGGSINATTIGASTASTGAFTTLSSTGATTLGNNLATITVDTTNWDVSSAGAVSGLTGLSLASGNFAQTGTGTFSTGTGTVSLNGITTVAAGKSLIVTGGAGDPTVTAGTIWYDTTAGKFKIVEGASVKVLCNTTDLGCGAGGGGVSTIKEGGINIVTSATALNYATNDFAVTDETGGQAGIAIDYTNSKITRTDQVQTITGGWTFNTAATTFSTAVNANSGVTTSTLDTSLAFTANGAGDYTFATDSDSNFQINATPTGDVTFNSAVLTLTPSGTGSTNTLQGLLISQADTATTGVYDSLVKIENLKTPETTTNGLFIQNNAAGGTLSSAVHITNTAGTLTDAITVDGTAPSGFILNTTSIGISGAGAITGAQGVSSTTLTASAAIAANGGITFDNSTDTLGAFTAAGLIDLNTSYYLTNIGNANTDFTNTGGLNLAGTLAVNSGSITSSTNMTVDAGSFTIGAGADTGTAAFATTTNALSFTGTARPTRKVTLSPEYPGAVLTGDGGSNTGTMTSDFCAASLGVGGLPTTINTSVCNTSGDTHNYYQWTTTQGTAQDYDIWVKWRVPDNFAAWAASNPVSVYAKTNDATNGDVKLYIYDTANAVETNANNADITTSANAWLQTSISSLGGTYTAGSFMTFRIVMNGAATTGVTQVGEITLDYLTSN